MAEGFGVDWLEGVEVRGLFAAGGGHAMTHKVFKIVITQTIIQFTLSN